MIYPDFSTRWQQAGGAERVNYGLFLQDLCDLLQVLRPDPTTNDPAQYAYVLERAVTFASGGTGGKGSTGRINLYKRGCFVLETKQGTDTPDQQAKAAKAELDLPADKRRKGHAVRGTTKWGQMMEAARQQALGYVRALPGSEPRPPFVVVDVSYCIDLYSNFAGVGDNYVPFPDSQTYRLRLVDLANEKVHARLTQLFTDPQQLDPSRRATPPHACSSTWPSKFPPITPTPQPSATNSPSPRPAKPAASSPPSKPPSSTPKPARPPSATPARSPGTNGPAPPPRKPGPATALPHPAQPLASPAMALAKKHDQLPLDLNQLYAADITGVILAFLTHHSYTVWRQNTTGVYDAAKACWRVNPRSCRGVPDIMGFRNRDGVFIGVEVKAGRDQLRDDQRTFLNELKAAHGLAFVAHSFAQFQQSFESRLAGS